ncbi:hypothetical protein L210DRAFT_3653545 [Boletus edulis BED1]|uniref:Uncharacterized protein n=1 Tax=Boletus edulis BED1 TaxID=1328754 RepID=A0AAD4BF97_BOLED|nr:hypothetical protein L210DRAFT_3653545 [Boletus edulis BED1]
MKHDIGVKSFEYQESGVPRTRDLQSGRIHKSRESCGVWRFRDEAWKVFSSMDQYGKIKNDYEGARNKGVPIPEFEFKRGYVYDKNGRRREGFALVVTYITSGRRFTLPKDCTNLKTAIRSITKDKVLQKIEHGLRKAIEAGVVDPQGFIDPENVKSPITFIDIHTKSTPSLALDELHKFALGRINDVQSQS